MKIFKIILIICVLIALVLILFRKQIAELFAPSKKGGQGFNPVKQTNLTVKSPENPNDKIYFEFSKSINNPFNIRAVSANDWRGKVTKEDAEFESFDTIINGVRAGIKVLKTYFSKHGLNTIEGILYRYAPPEDSNDTEGYIRFAEDSTGFKRDTVLQPDAETLYALSKVMCKMENGFNLEKSLFDEAYILA